MQNLRVGIRTGQGYMALSLKICILNIMYVLKLVYFVRGSHEKAI